MSEPAEAIPEVTEICPEPGCGHEVTGPAEGRGSAKWKMGAHRANAHGYRSAEPKQTKARATRQADAAQVKQKKGRTAPDAEDFATRPVTSTVKSITGEAGAGTKKTPPNADDLARGLGRGVSLVSIAVASWMAETDDGIPWDESGDAERDRIVADLSLSDKAGKEVMVPLARAIAPTRVNRRFGRGIVDNADAVGSIAELGTLFLHYRRYFRQRRNRERYGIVSGPPAGAMPAGLPIPWQPQPGPAQYRDEPAEPMAPAAPPPGAAQTPPPLNGRVVSAEDVAHLQAAAAGGYPMPQRGG